MKHFTYAVFLAFFSLTTVLSPYARACDYSVVLWDSYGDGWNGGALTILVNGNAVITNATLADGSGPAVYSFSVNHGDAISTVYTAGSWSSENFYYIYDSQGNQVFADGLNEQTPVGGFAANGVCPENDLGVSAWLYPRYLCSPGTDSIVVMVTNQGIYAKSGFVVSYSIDGGLTWLTDTINATLNPGDTLIHRFSQLASFPQFSSYQAIAVVHHSVDDYRVNDTLRFEVYITPNINSFPYVEGFESGPGYWYSRGLMNSWEHGTPASASLAAAYEGSSVWATNLDGVYNNNEYSWVESPCFDFSGLINPEVEFAIWYKTDAWDDGAAFQYTIDGINWDWVGQVNTGTNWYNDWGISALSYFGDDEGWTNQSYGWLQAHHNLVFLAGQPFVKFRFIFAAGISDVDEGFAFDAFRIFQPPYMSFISAEAFHSDTTETAQGKEAANILGVRITTSGRTSPISLNALHFSPTGSTLPHTDISRSRVFGTELNPVFATWAQFDDAAFSPDSLSFEGDWQLEEGDNYFWLAYDVASDAIPGNRLDASVDSIVVGDTLRSVINPDPAGSRLILEAMAGEYIIDLNGSGDYLSFNEAVADLILRGVKDTVLFRVKPGQYNERITITEFNGASSQSPVIFEPYLPDRTSVVLGMENTTTTDNHIIHLQGADHVIFRHMTIKAFPSLVKATYGNVIKCSNSANHNYFVSNIITGIPSSTTSLDYAVIRILSYCEDIQIHDNLISNGSTGIYAYGYSSPTNAPGIGVLYNMITDFYYMGINLQYQSYPACVANFISTSSNYSTLYGIYMYGCTDPAQVFMNEIQLGGNGTRYGIYLTNLSGSSKGRNLVANNFISTPQTTTSMHSGINVTGCSHVSIVHNSVQHASASNSTRGVWVSNSPQTYLINNIFSSPKGGQCFLIQDSTNITWKGRNIFYTTNSFVGTLNGIAMNWQSYMNSGFSPTDLFKDPEFFGTTDLHTFNPLLNNIGIPFPDVSEDIDGEPRSQTNPDPGADEFTPPPFEAMLADIYQPYSGCDIGLVQIGIMIVNRGSDTINGGLNAYYTIDNQTTVSAAVNDIIPPLDTLLFFFPGMVDFSTGASDTSFYMETWINLNGDAFPANDSIRRTIVSIYSPPPPVTTNATIPYGQQASLTATSSDDVYWFANTTTNNSLYTGLTFNTPPLYDNTTYYAAARAPGENLKITELLFSYNATGATAVYPSFVPAGDWRCVEITNLGQGTASLAGYTMEIWSGQSLTWKFPSYITLGPSQVMLLVFYSVNPVTDDPANNLYVISTLLPITSTTASGFILRKPDGQIADAVGSYSYTFPTASGVTIFDWSGNISGSGRAGISRSISDNNKSSDWYQPTNTNRQTIGSVNVGLTSVRGNGCFSSRVPATVTLTNVPLLGIPTVSPDTLISTIIDCDGQANLQVTLGNIGDTILDWSTTVSQRQRFDSTSYKQFTTSGATTTHIFNVGSTAADTLFLDIVINGDYSDAGESCNLNIDGTLIGTLNDLDIVDGVDIPITLFFTGTAVQGWMADGIVNINLINTSAVGYGWGTSSHKVRLRINGGEKWVVIPQTSGSIPVSGTNNLAVTFSANGLREGTYTGKFIIGFNTPRTPVKYVHTILTVVGSPEIMLTETCHDLGIIMQHRDTTRTFTLANTGCDTLYIDSLVTDNNVFQAWANKTMVAPDSVITYSVRFSSDQIGSHSGNLTFFTNIGDTSVCLEAETFAAPVIAVMPDTLVANLVQCIDSTTLSFVISNVGPGILDYHIQDLGMGSPLPACIPVTTGYCCGMGIYQVQFAGIDHTTGDGSQGYQDYTATQRAVVNPGQSYQLYVRTGTSYNEHVSAWIDWNENGLFEGTELVLQTTNTYVNHYATVTVPLTAAKGKALRMRVASDYYGRPQPSPCSSVQYGQHEDYTVTVTGGMNLTSNTGTLNPTESDTIEATFYSANLYSGQYFSEIRIESNDPLSPLSIITTVLNLTGIPEISSRPDSLMFDSAMIGATTCLSGKVLNPGCSTLVVNAISFQTSHFNAPFTPIHIPPGDSAMVTICFSPQTTGLLIDTAILTSNAQDARFILVGQGLPAPNIQVFPDSFDLVIQNCNDTLDTLLLVSNTGAVDLFYHIRSNTGTVMLDTVLSQLNQYNTAITGIIPNRFNFTEGESGNNINDGTSDMYDGGNYLNTNFGTNLVYSNNTIANSTYFGAGGRYFTRKYTGLWVLGADLDNVSYFEITGNLGADGNGNMDASILNTSMNGISYLGYVKRVYNAGDPSVNHLIIVEDNPNTSQTFSTNTNDDQHRVSGMNGLNRMYYLLYAGSSGYYIHDTTALKIMIAFLNVINTSPEWVQLSLTDDTVSAGQQSQVNLTIVTSNLTSGQYHAHIDITSNDPDQPLITLPVFLDYSGLPEIQLSETFLDFGNTMLGTTQQHQVWIYNPGCDTLEIQTLSVSQPSEFGWQPLAPQYVQPFDSLQLTVIYHPTYTGQIMDTLQFATNAGNRSIELTGIGVPEPEISTNPASFNVVIAGCDDTVTRDLTIYNTGLGDLNYQIIGGYGNSLDTTSTKYYSTSGAITTHTFPGLAINTDSLVLIITINGDFDYSYEYASLFIEGQFIAQIDDGNPVNGTNIVRIFTFGYQQILAWLADGVLQVQIQNSGDVDHWGGLVSMHQVQLIINTADWMSFSSTSGSVPSGDSSLVTIFLSSTDLYAGTYYSNIVITSNDPYNPSVVVPCTLSVTGHPIMSWSPSCLDYGTVLVGNTSDDTLTISNTGCSSLTIQSITTALPVFSIVQSPASIPPNGQAKVILRFTPATAMYYEDTLSISTNDGEARICLTATGAAPPILSYTPSSLSATITQCNDTVSIPLTISNIGVEDLHYQLTGSAEDTVRILGMIYASSTSLLNQAISALQQQFTKFSVTTFSSSSTSSLQAALNGIDVVLIPRFTSNASSVYSNFGPILQSFVNQGGVVIFCGIYESSYSQSMYSTNLLSGSYASYITSGTVNLTNLSDPLVQGLPTGISASQYVFYHTFTNPDLVVLGTYGNYHAIAYRNIGKGSVVYLGYDLTQYQAHAATILSRAVQLGKKNLFVNWLSLNRTTDTVPANQSSLVQVLFDATGMNSGLYESQIIIKTNVPGGNTDTIPCTMQINGAPLPIYPQACVDLGSVMIGGQLNGQFILRNDGCADLTITGTSHISQQFVYTLAPMTITPGSSYTVPVQFSSAITGPYSDTISIVTNAGVLKVCLLAVALSAPEVEITPMSLSATLNSCTDSTTAQLVISNPGNALLNWSIPAQTQPGYGLSFDGVDDYVNLGAWTAGNRWTLEAWVNPSSVPAGRRTIAGAVHQCADWALSMVDGQFALLIKPNSAICSYILYSGVYPIPGKWYHVAATNNGTLATILINGQVAATGNVSVDYAGTSSGVRIGGEFCCYGNSFPGRIDDVRIWSIQRNANDIKAGMFTELTGTESGLAGYWPMNEGSGGTINDKSPFARNGAILGPTWVADTKPASWVLGYPAAGMTGPGSEDTVTVKFRSVGLINGNYIKNLQFATDDPVHPIVSVACTLTVNGQGQLSLPPGCLTFPPIMQYAQSSLILPVQNVGCENVTVQSISFGNSNYAAIPASFNLAPGTIQNVQVTFSPTTVGNHNTTMTFNTSVGAVPQCLSGTATERPVAQVLEDTLVGMPTCSETDMEFLVVSNLGNPLLTVNYQLQPSVPWATLVSGSPLNIPGGTAGNIIILFDKTGMNTGTYTSNLVMQTNDPLHPTIQVLVQLVVPNVLAHVNLGPDTAGCIGTSITLSAGSYASYLWNTTATSSSIQVSTTGIYSVSVVDAYGCPSADSIFVGFYDNPVVSLGADISTCESYELILDANVTGLPSINMADVIVGTGGSFTTNTTATPFKTYFADGRTQMLYTKADLIQAGFEQGKIETIGFLVDAPGNVPMSGFTIKIKESTQTSLNGFATDMQVVYHRTTMGTSVGWNMYTLDLPFLYSGNGSLIVEVCFDNAVWGASSSIQYTSTSSKVWGVSCDNCAPGCNLGGGSSTNLRANLRIVGDKMKAKYYWSGPNGLTSSALQLSLNPVQLSHTGNYILVVDNGWGCTGRDTVYVNVLETPVVDAGPGDTILQGQSVQLMGSATGGSTPYVISWTPVSSLSDPSAFQPMASPQETTVYTLHVTSADGCLGMDQTKISVIPVRDIYGKLTYGNAAITPLSDVKILLNSNQGPYDSTLTDNAGNYLFRAPEGTYSLSPRIVKSWGGVNATDALEVAKHAVFLTQLTGLYLEAADVNLSGSINATDALLIMRRYVGQISSFAIPDWVFSPKGNFGVIFTNSLKDITALCAGDVNGSYIPGKSATSLVTLEYVPGLGLNHQDALILPVHAASYIELGAVSLEFIIPEALGFVTDVTSELKGIVYHQEGQRLRIGWHETIPKYFQPDDVLLYLHFKGSNLPDVPQFIGLGLASEAADGNGNIQEVRLYTSSVARGGTNPVIGENYPDPFGNFTHIPYYLPRESEVQITMHDLMGRQLAVLFQGRQTSGSHLLTFDGSHWQPGVYFYRLHIDGKQTDGPANKMVISR